MKNGRNRRADDDRRSPHEEDEEYRTDEPIQMPATWATRGQRCGNRETNEARLNSVVSRMEEESIAQERPATANRSDVRDRAHRSIVVPVWSDEFGAIARRTSRNDATRFQLASDLHVEMTIDDPVVPVEFPDVVAPILVLAGDVYVGRRENYADVIRGFSDRWERVVYVAGNHEVYNGDGEDGQRYYLERIHSHIEDVCLRLPNVAFLNDGYVEVGKTTFFGGTGWTDVPRQLWSISDCFMNDYSNVFTSRRGRVTRFSPETAYELHKEFAAKLEAFLDGYKRTRKDADPDRRLVVVTHHCPSYAYRGMEWTRDEMYAPWYFSSDMARFVRPPVDVWAYGHTHASCNMVNSAGVKVISNPMGYRPEQLNPSYSKRFVVVL